MYVCIYISYLYISYIYMCVIYKRIYRLPESHRAELLRTNSIVRKMTVKNM